MLSKCYYKLSRSRLDLCQMKIWGLSSLAHGGVLHLTSPKGDKLSYVLQIVFDCSNNVAEYEALLHGL